jgi:hypothetical protein
MLLAVMLCLAHKIPDRLLAADPRITEEIKWNAPSFKMADHFLTFKLHPQKNIQLIFHVGAKPLLPPRRFTLELPKSATKLPAQDRCVLTIADSKHAEEMAVQVARAVQQWLVQLQM